MYKNLITNTLTLAGGTYIAQIITLISLPLLSRLFIPKLFGEFAIYMAILLLLSSISTLRYEFAIVQTKNKEESINVVIICLILNVLITFLTFVIIFFFLFEFKIFKNIGLYIYLIPVNLLFLGSLNILKNWFLNNNQYKSISKLSIVQNILVFTFQISLGLIGLNKGLILGYFIGNTLIFFYVFYNFVQLFKEIENLSIGRLKITAKKYANLPKFSTFGVFADNFSIQAPIFILSSSFSSTFIGSFNMVMRALHFPLSAISNSINNVLFKQVASLTNDKSRLVRSLIIKTSFVLLLVMLPFIFIFWFFGPDLFLIVLGREWVFAGELSRILVFVIAIRFIVSSCNSIMLINQNIKYGVIWQFFRLCTITVTLSYSVYLDISFNFLMYIFLVHEFIVYLIYYLLILNKSNLS